MIKMVNQSKKNGSALLISLLVMTGILTISLATGILIMNEIQQSSQLERSMTAYYAGESGIERSLYQVRKKSIDPLTFNQFSAVLTNNSSFQLFTQTSENVIYRTLQSDETLQLDLYQPASLSPLSPAIKSLTLSWLAEPGSWLEVRWLPWTTAGVLNPNPEVDWQERGKELSPAGSYIINLLNSNIYLYKVRITARNALVSNLEIKAYEEINAAGNQAAIPGWIKIKSLGEYPNNVEGAAKQAVIITMPQKSPLAGLYDYVLFSEQPIVKENY